MSHSAENQRKKINLEEKMPYRRTKKEKIGYVSQKVRRFDEPLKFSLL